LKIKGKYRENELRVIGEWVTVVGIGFIALGIILVVMPQ